ncbi:MAG: FHA domain-containing protein [Deltaproteobacteria bacterium]|nr:FHA domain-containing protein [Deltaproteobacteria bacterium]
MASPRKSAPARAAAAPQARKAAAPAPPDAFLGEPASERLDTVPAKGRPADARQRPGVAVSNMVGVLEVVQGPDQDASLPLEPGRTYSVGRGRDNDLVLRDIVASRRHVQFTVRGAQLVVEDQGSGNGTRVNGKRVKEALIADGDQVEIGNTVMRFSASAPVRSAPPPQGEKGPWNDVRTVQGTEAEQLKREFLEESLRADARHAPRGAPAPRPEPPKSSARGDATERRTRESVTRPHGVQGVGVSRSTVIVVLLVALAVVLVALSVTVAVLLTRTSGGPVATTPLPQEEASFAQRLANRALEHESGGKSNEADAVMELLKEQDPELYAATRRKLDMYRAQLAARRRSEEPARPAPEPARAEPPPPRAAEPAPEPAPAPAREPVREAPPPEEKPREAAPQKAAPPPKAAPAPKPAPAPRQAQKPAPRPAPKPAPKPAARPAPKPKRLSAEEGTALLQNASELAKDDKLKDAVRLVRQVLDQCDDEDVRKKAEGRLARYQKKLEGM